MSRFALGHWAQRGPRAILLLPVTCLFFCVSQLRRWLYQFHLLKASSLPVPVVVIGNIHVGGVGKTPLTITLIQALKAAGFSPGIISRGYGRKQDGVAAVTAKSTPAEVGDEPLLLAMTTACPVFVGSNRLEAGRALLAANPEVDVILSDDGLQHYALARDLEICVLDGYRGWGNAWLLPSGPLREGKQRLATVDAVVIHGHPDLLPGIPAGPVQFEMVLQPASICRLQAPAAPINAESLKGKTILAIAGIGDPERFFNTLRQLGLSFTAKAFPDHHNYVASDLKTDAEIILMTEKDAVKCRSLDDGKIHVLPVAASIKPDLAPWLITRLRSLDGRQTA